MTLSEARYLRDLIRAAGLHCTVPLGHGPDGYFARIWTSIGVEGGMGLACDFYDADDWQAYHEAKDRLRRERDAKQKRLSRPRSPIEAMIDQACGISPEDTR